jgi:hypothetical protein
MDEMPDFLQVEGITNFATGKPSPHKTASCSSVVRGTKNDGLRGCSRYVAGT